MRQNFQTTILPLTAALLTLLLTACNNAPASSPDEPRDGPLGPNAAIIRNPVDQGPDNVDTTNVARFNFEHTEYEFGTVRQGKMVNHKFKFTNSGQAPLIISGARSTCGCTVPSYPEAPIQPGESGVIEVAFDTENKRGRQRKPVTITANTYPASTTIYVSGEVTTE